MIREATHADIEPIIQLLTRLKTRTVYAATKVSREKATRTLRQCISGPQAYAEVAVDEAGEIIGVLLGVKEPIWFADALEAKDIGFHALRAADARDLLADFNAWAFADSRVDAVLMAQSSGVEVARTGKWFELQGFEPVGGVFRLGRWDYMEQQVAA